MEGELAAATESGDEASVLLKRLQLYQQEMKGRDQEYVARCRAENEEVHRALRFFSETTHAFLKLKRGMPSIAAPGEFCLHTHTHIPPSYFLLSPFESALISGMCKPDRPSPVFLSTLEPMKQAYKYIPAPALKVGAIKLLFLSHPELAPNTKIERGGGNPKKKKRKGEKRKTTSATDGFGSRIRVGSSSSNNSHSSANPQERARRVVREEIEETYRRKYRGATRRGKGCL